MKIFTAKRGKGLTTTLVKQWHTTGGLLIASDFVIRKYAHIPAHEGVLCSAMTHMAAANQNNLCGLKVSYIYIDDIDVFIHHIFSANLGSYGTIFGGACSDIIESIHDKDKREKSSTGDDVKYLCPCCGRIIRHVDKKTTHTEHVTLSL